MKQFFGWVLLFIYSQIMRRNRHQFKIKDHQMQINHINLVD